MTDTVLNQYRKALVLPLNEANLNDWYSKCYPGGSGPLFLMRLVCALIEEVCELKGYKLNDHPKWRK